MSGSPSAPPFTQSRWVSLLVALGLMVLYIIIQTVVVLVVLIAAFALAAMNVAPVTVVSLVQNGVVVGGASGISGLLGIGLVWLIVSRAGRRAFRAPMALVPSRGWPLWAFPLVAIAAALMFDAVTVLLGRPIVPEVLQPYFEGPGAVLVMALATVLVAPVVEELLFRGALYGAVERFVPAWLAVVLTALPFGVLHLMTYGPDWYSVVQTAVAGLILGALRARTGSLWPGIVFHAFNNLYAVVEAAVLVNLLRGL